MIKVILTGASGQLGKTLIKTKPESINLFTPIRSEIDLSNMYSEKNNCTILWSKFVAPVVGVEYNKNGGVSSFGPPDGAWIAAQEKTLNK